MQRIYPRYQKASRAEKQRILDEFCANCSYHRKHAIRVLNRPRPAPQPAANSAVLNAYVVVFGVVAEALARRR